MATQYSVYGSANDPVKDALVLQEIGITAGSRLSDPGSDPQTITWDAKVLLASGTFSGGMGSLSVSPRAGETWSLLSDTGGGAWSGPGNLESPSAVNGYSQPIIPADFDLDGAVDVTDLGILATSYGQTSGMMWADGDADGDGTVNVSDLGILATYYGTGTTFAAVPEPAALVLLGGLLTMVGFCRLAAQTPRGSAMSRKRSSP